MKKGYSVVFLWCFIAFLKNNHPSTHALLSCSTSLYRIPKEARGAAMSSWSYSAVHREWFRCMGSWEFKTPQAEEATQFGFLLPLATKGTRKAVYKHHLLLQQFVNLAHLCHALFMSEWKAIGFVSDRISKCWKEWQISGVFFFFKFWPYKYTDRILFPVWIKICWLFFSRAIIKQDEYKWTL